jgi:hypothetical protein
MSQIQFGLPLENPSKQTLLPIVMPSGNICGFFPITETTFTGTETSYALTQGSVPLTTVTLPSQTETIYGPQRVQQYMAVQWPQEQQALMPWKGYVELVDVSDPNDLGYYSWWSLPVTTWFKHFGNGSYIDSLIKGMDKYTFTPPNTTPPPVNTPQPIKWACTLNMSAFTGDCSFFDWNWFEGFQMVAKADTGRYGCTVIPVQLQVVSNPPGGYFKAVLVQDAGQTIVPGGGVTFNTLRILRLQDPPAGSYPFNFNISYKYSSQDTSTANVPAVLNLTVV